MIVTRVYVGNKEGLSQFDMKYSSSSVYFFRYLHLFSIATQCFIERIGRLSFSGLSFKYQ